MPNHLYRAKLDLGYTEVEVYGQTRSSALKLALEALVGLGEDPIKHEPDLKSSIVRVGTGTVLVGGEPPKQKMNVVFYIDDDNWSKKWWTAAKKNIRGCPKQLRTLITIKDEGIVVTPQVAARFMKWAKSLPGWDKDRGATLYPVPASQRADHPIWSEPTNDPVTPANPT